MWFSTDGFIWVSKLKYWLGSMYAAIRLKQKLNMLVMYEFDCKAVTLNDGKS